MKHVLLLAALGTRDLDPVAVAARRCSVPVVSLRLNSANSTTYFCDQLIEQAQPGELATLACRRCRNVVLSSTVSGIGWLD